jgi:hypothetical protein
LHLRIVERVIEILGPLGARIVEEDPSGTVLMKTLLPGDLKPISTDSFR